MKNIVELSRVCAVFDAPYMARYEQDFRSYRFAGAVKIGANASGLAAPSVQPVTFNMSQFQGIETCIWCGADDIACCDGECYMWVCLGRTRRGWRGRYFQCRESCGAKGWLVEYEGVFQGTLATVQDALQRFKVQPQQAAPQGHGPAFPASTGSTALPANGNARALPGQSKRTLLK